MKAPSFKKILNIIQILTFIVTSATAIPLLVSYLRDVDSAFPLFTHLHVWFGFVFILVAITRMAAMKKLDMQRSTPKDHAAERFK